MSLEAQSLVWQGFTNGTATEKLIMLKIADCANEFGGHSHPGHASLAMAANCSKRTVVRLIDKLIKEEFVAVEKHSNGPGRATIYALNTKKLAGNIRQKGDKMSPIQDGKGDTAMSPVENRTGDTQMSPIKGDKMSPIHPERVTNHPRKGDTQMSPQPINNLSKNNQRQLRSTGGVNCGHPQTVNAAMDLAQTKPITASHIEHLQKHPTPPSTGDDLKHDLLMLGIPAPPTANTADLLSIHHLRAATIRERLAIQQAQHQEAKA
ncbi:MAG: helix-turn-helix domain-containing protein [Pseudomonadota bacterium]